MREKGVKGFIIAKKILYNMLKENQSLNTTITK